MKNNSKYASIIYLLLAIIFLRFIGEFAVMLLIGLIPAILIFIVLILLRNKQYKRFKKYSNWEIIQTSIGWGITIGLVIVILVTLIRTSF